MNHYTGEKQKLLYRQEKQKLVFRRKPETILQERNRNYFTGDKQKVRQKINRNCYAGAKEKLVHRKERKITEQKRETKNETEKRSQQLALFGQRSVVDGIYYYKFGGFVNQYGVEMPTDLRFMN